MVSFLRSNAAIAAAVLASSLATSDAAYSRMFHHHRPRYSTALGSRMLPGFGGGGLLSRDVRQVMRDVDAMFDQFDDMLGGAMDEAFRDPFFAQAQRAMAQQPPRYLLQGSSPEATARTLMNALAHPGSTGRVGSALGVTQDDKQVRIALELPAGTDAGDVSLQLEEDGRVLRISGETKREEGGISVHSRFDRAFTLGREVDTNGVTAAIDGGVLTITAPKLQEAREAVRKIDIAVNDKIEAATEEKADAAMQQEENADVAAEHEQKESLEAKPDVVDDSVIDLDVEKE